MFETSKPLFSLFLGFISRFNENESSSTYYNYSTYYNTIIAFPHIADFGVKIELNCNRASTRHWNPSATWNYAPWKITEHFNSQNSAYHPTPPAFTGTYTTMVSELLSSKSPPTSRIYFSPRWKQQKIFEAPDLKQLEDIDPQYPWGENKAKWGHFVFCTYLLVSMPPFPKSSLVENYFSNFTLVKTHAHSMNSFPAF